MINSSAVNQYLNIYSLHITLRNPIELSSMYTHQNFHSIAYSHNTHQTVKLKISVQTPYIIYNVTI